LKLGLEGSLDRLSSRAGEEWEALARLFFRLVWVAMCLRLALLEGVDHRRDTLQALTRLGAGYAEEAEDYLDTLSLLLDDEALQALEAYM